MTEREIQCLFIKQWLVVAMHHGEPQWSSAEWLDLWEDLLGANWHDCREQGVTLRRWLRALRRLDHEYIGADWLIYWPKRPEFLGGEYG